MSTRSRARQRAPKARRSSQSPKPRAEQRARHAEPRRPPFPFKASELYHDCPTIDHYERLIDRFEALDRSGRPLPSLPLVHLARSHKWWARTLESWDPRGARRRTQERLLRSLIDHLLVPRYAPPAILYRAFSTSEPEGDWLEAWRLCRAPARQLSPWVWVFIRVAQGDPLFEVLRDPLRLTLSRRGCHLFSLSDPRLTPVAAYRAAQLGSHRAPREIIAAIRGAFLSRGLQRDEPFYEEVLAWLARRPEFNREAGARFVAPHAIPPLLDYLRHLRAEGGLPTMKGRSPKALLRGMQAWHAELAQIRYGFQGRPLPEDGLEPMRWTVEAPEPVEWVMLAIRDERDLVEEGRVMRHCVASYARAIHQGRSSIWSLRAAGRPRLTVEICPATRTIVQARGKANRRPSKAERRHLKSWAQANDLSILLGV